MLDAAYLVGEESFNFLKGWKPCLAQELFS